MKFWMRSYLSPSMKPTMVITNQNILGALDAGPVPERLKKRSKPTTKRYRDRHGKIRFAGTSSLKQSQILRLVWGKDVHVVWCI